MSYLFSTTLLLSIIILIAGLIKPSIFKKTIKTIPKRKTIALVCFGAIVISFLGIGAFAPDTEEKKDTNILVNNEEQQTIPQTTATTTIEIVATSTEPVAVDSDNKTVPQVVEVKTTQPEKQVSTPATQINSQYEYYSVSSVVDGDTIKININGMIETLRLIGMDTPETVDPRKPVQCFGKEASDKAKELLIGKKVRIEKDPTQGDLDIYGRQLAYIYREDRLFYNKYMIEQGYAHEYTYKVPYKYQAEFKQAETEAQNAKRGLWADNVCAQENEPTDQTPPATQSGSKYYTSSHYSAKYYYPESCDGWKTLSEKYLKSYDSLDALLKVYPTKILSPQCQ